MGKKVKQEREEKSMSLIKELKSAGDWILDANCKNMDTNLFFPEVNKHYDDFIREVCFTCPVIDECAWYANETSAVYGMFGGMTPTEREQWRKKNKVILGDSRNDWEAR